MNHFMNRFNINQLVKTQFPEFIQEEHGFFVSFIQAYYEWMEKNPDKIRIPSQLDKIFDVDDTMEVFIRDFQKTYLSSFPVNLVIDQQTGKKFPIRKLIKNIKGFYKSKGIEASYSFIFRILYNSEIEIYYPKKFIMNLSDGAWIREKKMYIDPILTNSLNRIIGSNICQREVEFDHDSNIIANALVKNAVFYTSNSIPVMELEIDEIFGNFQEERFIFDIQTNENYGKIYSVLTDIKIKNSGSGYLPNDKFIFEPVNNEFPKKFPNVFVSRVLPVNAGTPTENLLSSNGNGLLEITIENPGLGVAEGNCEFNNRLITEGGTGCDVEIFFGSVFDKKEYYLGSRGILGLDMVLQDNYKYQNYSYVLRTDISISKFKDRVMELLHPAGVEILFETLIKKCIQANVSVFTNIPQKFTKRIGNYLPYTFLTYDDLSLWMAGNCYNPSIHDNQIINCLADLQPDVPCITGNPISSLIERIDSNLTGCVTADLPLEASSPWWITFSHPNTYITDGIVFVYSDQIDDFYNPSASISGNESWREWSLSLENTGTGIDGENQRIEWLNAFNQSNEPSKLVSLNLDSLSEFRKIPIYRFFEDFSCNYDCRYSNNCVDDINE
jgi:hypothetical protein